MQTYEIPLRRAHAGTDTIENLRTARLMMDLLTEEECLSEAPDVDPSSVSLVELFEKLPGPGYQSRYEELNIEQEVSKMPKAYDVPLALAHGDDHLPTARRLLEELLESGRAHMEVEQCRDFFERFERREAAEEELAEIAAEEYKEQLLRDIRDSDELP